MNNPLLSYPGYLLRRAAISRLNQLEKKLEPLGLSVTEASILAIIYHNPDISQAQCGRMLSIKRPNLNPIMHRLVDRGYVDVIKGSGRAQDLRLNDLGVDLAKKTIVAFEAHEEQIFASVPAHLRDELITMLKALWVED